MRDIMDSEYRPSMLAEMWRGPEAFWLTIIAALLTAWVLFGPRAEAASPKFQVRVGAPYDVVLCIPAGCQAGTMVPQAYDKDSKRVQVGGWWIREEALVYMRPHVDDVPPPAEGFPGSLKAER